MGSKQIELIVRKESLWLLFLVGMLVGVGCQIQPSEWALEWATHWELVQGTSYCCWNFSVHGQSLSPLAGAQA